MQSGRIGRTARRGIAVLTLGWLLAMAGSVLAAPTASAAPTATVEIKTLTPPVVSIDAGGTATFVNSVASYPASITLPLVGTLGATVYTDIAVTFNGSTQSLQPGQSAAYTFPSSTVGAITYTYRVVSGTNLSAAVLNQLVNGVVATLPPLPVGTPFVVNTLVPLPNLPSANLPQLPPVNVAVPSTPVAVPTAPPAGGATDTGSAPVAPAPQTEAPAPAGDGTGYAYSVPGTTGQLAPVDTSAAAAFDPSRFTAGRSTGSGTATGGGGGGPGSYDGASVPVFGQLAGLNGSSLPTGDGVEVASDSSAAPDPALSVPALAAVVALAGVTAALVRTHLAQRAAHRS